MKRLDGKTALVTGASRGIGAAIARAFLENGAFVYLSDIDDGQGESLDSLTRLNLHRMSQVLLRRNAGLVAP